MKSNQSLQNDNVSHETFLEKITKVVLGICLSTAVVIAAVVLFPLLIIQALFNNSKNN